MLRAREPSLIPNLIQEPELFLFARHLAAVVSYARNVGTAEVHGSIPAAPCLRFCLGFRRATLGW